MKAQFNKFRSKFMKKFHSSYFQRFYKCITKYHCSVQNKSKRNPLHSNRSTNVKLTHLKSILDYMQVNEGGKCILYFQIQEFGSKLKATIRTVKQELRFRLLRGQDFQDCVGIHSMNGKSNGGLLGDKQVKKIL